MNIKNCKESLEYIFKAELTAFLWSHAGLGKTSIVKQYAKEMGWQFHPFYLGTMSDIGDILGLADFIRDKDGTAVATKFATPEWLAKAIRYCEENPDSGAIIFLDEFNRGRRDILNGMFSLALDKTFHTIKLPKNCHVIAAGNPPTDEYFTTDVNETALMARFVHIKLEPTFDEWLEFAKETGMDDNLVGFLKNQPELISDARQDFQLPVKVDRRAFERLDRLFKLNTPQHLMEGLMSGIIGIERTVAFAQYLKNCDKPLKGKAILDPKSRPTLEKWSDPDNTVSSLLNLTCDNLKEWLTEKGETPLTDKESDNLMWFLEAIPKDISFPLIVNLIKNNIFRTFSTNSKYEDKLVDIAKKAKGEAA